MFWIISTCLLASLCAALIVGPILKERAAETIPTEGFLFYVMRHNPLDVDRQVIGLDTSSLGDIIKRRGENGAWNIPIEPGLYVRVVQYFETVTDGTTGPIRTR